MLKTEFRLLLMFGLIRPNLCLGKYINNFFHVESNVYSSLTAHVITADYERKKYVLQAEPLSEERHTGEVLAAVFERLVENWKIKKNQVGAGWYHSKCYHMKPENK